MTSQLLKAHAFQRLHAGPGIFVIPNPWDAGSARLLEHLGFAALATTSAGLAFSLARPDGAAGRAETLANARAIVAATDLPVSADLENGFGEAPETAAETIRLAAEAGLVGGSIEDATGRSAEPIYGFDAAVARVAAAAAAARSLDFPFTLTARAEGYLHGRPDLDETIRRLRAFADAGADVVYAPGLTKPDDIAALVRAVDRPVNVLAGVAGSGLSVADLAALGVRRVSVGAALARAALGAFLRAATEIRDRGTFGFATEAATFGELNGIFAQPRT